MIAPKAILCMDIDGTLIDSDEQVHPKDVAILNAFPEAIVPILTTGRILHSAKGVLRENGAFLHDPLPIPGVFMNGGVTYQPGEILCNHHAFSPEIRQAVINLSMVFPQSAFTFFAIDSVYLVNPTAFGRHIADIHHLAASEIDTNQLPLEIIKLMILEPEPETMQEIRDQSRLFTAQTAMSLPFAYEINPPGIDKAASLKSLLMKMQITELPIFAVGDAENDIPLLEMAHTSFAPTTAHTKVLEIVDQLVPKENDGLLGPILSAILT